MQYCHDDFFKRIEIFSVKKLDEYINEYGINSLENLFNECIRLVSNQKRNEISIYTGTKYPPVEMAKKLFEVINKNKYINSISLVSRAYADAYFPRMDIGRINKELEKIQFPGIDYNVEFSDIFANYIDNNENLKAIYLSGENILIGKKICLAINKHKKIDKLVLYSYGIGGKLQECFSYILSSRLRELDIRHCYFKSEDIYSGFIKDLETSNIKKFRAVGNFLGATEFTSKIFDSLRISNTVVSFSINVHIGPTNHLSNSFYEFLDKCKSIRHLSVHASKDILPDDYHYNKTFGILKKRYGITKFYKSNVFSKGHSQFIERNLMFWNNGVISLKRKILKTIKKEKIKVPEYYPKLLLKYDRATLVINFENYMNKNKEKKRKNY